ncbi:MAG: SAM-dependent chlorinase/fluorinase [Pirellulales bacterium]
MNGRSIAELGPDLPALTKLKWPTVRRDETTIEGEILYVDPFGNLITNIRPTDLPAGVVDELSWRCGEHVVRGVSKTYGEARSGEAIALVGSYGYSELAVVDGNAARTFGAGEGTPIRVTWTRQA